MSVWVYKQSEKWTDEEGVTHTLWTVGYESQDGEWYPDSDHSDREEAAKRTAWLNGASAKNCEWCIRLHAGHGEST